jgi:sugar phosphate isomerase/epimerase
MRIRRNPPLHLTYCLNVHPGETWAENFAAVREKALRVRELVGRPGPFGLGLRLGSMAATALAHPAALAEFRTFCEANNLYVFTVNGFPYGPFHGTPVKDNVYRPDWRQKERLAYTNQLTGIMAALLPEGVQGTISTLPGSYKEWIKTQSDVQSMVENLAEAAWHAQEALARTGREIVIALEPEPDCFLESTPETVSFFTGPLRQFGVTYLEKAHALNAGEADALLARHLGVCFDTSHMAVGFEDLAASLTQLRGAGIRVGKLHLSSALSVREGADAAAALKGFCENVYLHQTRRRAPDGTTRSFPDLPAALAAPAGANDCWRVHFHVPLFLAEAGDLLSTQSLFTPRFAELIKDGITEHLEIETYTFGVLPASLAVRDVTEGIAREYKWVLEHLLRPL